MSLFRRQPQIVPSVLILVLLVTLAAATVAGLMACWPARMLVGGRAPDSFEASAAIAVEAAVEQEDYNDVLILGDSTAQCGLLPERFQDLTGLTAYSLGCPGVLGIEGYSVLLRLYLEHHPRPRAIVLSVNPEALGFEDDELGPAAVQERFFGCYGSREQVGFDLPVIFVLTRTGLMDQLARLRGRPCSKYFDEPIAGSFHWSFNELRNHIRSHRGCYLQEGELAPDATRFGSVSDTFPVTEQNRKSLRELAAQTCGASLPLIIRLTPVVDYSAAEHFPELLSLSTQLEEEFANVTFSRPQVIEFPTDLFFVTNHVNSRGAEQFTEIAADVVSGVLSDGAARTHRSQVSSEN